MIPCPVCQSQAVSRINKFSGVAACAECDHMYQFEPIITAVYDARYAHKYDAYPCEAISKIRANFIERSVPCIKSVLDVGYGNGSFLKEMRSRGCDVWGIDVHGEDFGVPEAAWDDRREYDLVTFFDSLEHFESFERLACLKSNAIAVSIPFRPPWFAKHPSQWRHFRPGEHLHYFSMKSLGHLMSNLGYVDFISSGFPEDAIRGKIGKHNNIYTAIYRR